jgi:hypothetical protein
MIRIAQGVTPREPGEDLLTLRTSADSSVMQKHPMGYLGSGCQFGRFESDGGDIVQQTWIRDYCDLKATTGSSNAARRAGM